MGYQMLNLSCRRVMISSKVIHNVGRCPRRQGIAKRAFSLTAKVGDVMKEDNESGFKISRVGSTRQTLVRSIFASATYYPSVSGETVLGDLVDDVKSDLQKSSEKAPLTGGGRTRMRQIRNKRAKDDSSSSITPNMVLDRKPSSLSPRQFSIISPDPKRTTKEQVLQLISNRARMTKARYLADPSLNPPEEAVVILVTPAFANWLEDENFIKQVLECFTYHHVDGKPNYVVVVGAVVDGLVPSPDDIPIAERAGPLEGFSFLHGLRSRVLRPDNVWNPESFKDNAKNPDKLSHLIISGNKLQKPWELALSTTISLPLANTLFVNGKHSTLEIAKWTRRNEGEYKCIQREQKQYQHIKAFHYENTMIPPIFVPAVPLTLPRPIANGLGNIVRQLSFGSGDTDNRPASSELETQVTRFMEYSNLHTNIGVWALIYRKELLDPNLKASTLESAEDLESTWSNDDKNLRFVGTQIALGAILCRVVSGGGGWGAKQGLLSLDPQMTYEDIVSASFEYTDQSMEKAQDSTLGNLARRGDHIQFFTINPSKLKEPGTPMDIPESNETTDANSIVDDKVARKRLLTQEPEKTELNLRDATDLSWSSRTTFGVVPSTIDEIPSYDIHDSSTSNETLPFLSFHKGEFGAVSESGIYLHSSHQKRINAKSHELINTKIDMPYSYIYRDQPGTSPKQTEEYKMRMNSLLGRFSSDAKNSESLFEMTSRFIVTTGRVPTREEQNELLEKCNINPRIVAAKKKGGVTYARMLVWEAEKEMKNMISQARLLSRETGMHEAFEKIFPEVEERNVIRKKRVGHTRWPKFVGEKERREVEVRKVKVFPTEKKFRFSYGEESGGSKV
ncbi:uncharacterized protein EAF01_009281 [Botrytis porri]|uniref:uncharacterized protein n=1 Tax=Botrytis porri TaxID=87229 RepID=UPI00190002A6|nr:uncharacterized protein EAF01_009281 [Botrytis porri]KAF7896878.1 hypothetical protein EAF01_009281 [Botrytis porri]